MLTGWFAQLAARAVSVLASLVSVGVLAQHLGPGEFGEWTVVVAWIGMAAPLADLGMTQTVLRVTSNARRGVASLELTVRGALGVQLLVTTIAVPVVALLGSALLTGSVSMFLVGAASLVPTGVYLVLQIPLVAGGRFVTLAVVEGAARVLTATVTALAAISGARPPALLLVISLPSCVGALLLLVIRHGDGGKRPLLDGALARELLRAGLPIAASMALFSIYLRIDSLLLSTLASQADVGVYGLAYRVVEAVLAVPGLLMVVIYPQLVRAQDQPEVLRLLLQRMTKVLVVAAAPVLVAALVAGSDVMRALGGPSYVRGSITLQLLLLSCVVSFGTALLGQLLIARGEGPYLLAFSVGNVLLNVAANLLLIPLLGLPGAATSTLTTELVALAVVGRRAVRHGHLVVPWSYFGRVAGCVFGAVLAQFLLRHAMPGLGADLIALLVLAALLWASRACTAALLRDLAPGHA